jgi:hypothetical protein
VENCLNCTVLLRQRTSTPSSRVCRSSHVPAPALAAWAITIIAWQTGSLSCAKHAAASAKTLTPPSIASIEGLRMSSTRRAATIAQNYAGTRAEQRSKRVTSHKLSAAASLGRTIAILLWAAAGEFLLRQAIIARPQIPQTTCQRSGQAQMPRRLQRSGRLVRSATDWPTCGVISAKRR